MKRPNYLSIFNNSINHIISASTNVVIAAIVGSLSCAMLLVLVLGFSFKLYIVRMHSSSTSRYVSPIMEIRDQIFARLSAPPPYLEAMETSRSYEEFRREVLSDISSNEIIETAENSILSTDEDLIVVEIQRNNVQQTPSMKRYRCDDDDAFLECFETNKADVVAPPISATCENAEKEDINALLSFSSSESCEFDDQDLHPLIL